MKKWVVTLMICGLGMTACSRKEEAPKPIIKTFNDPARTGGGSALSVMSPVQFTGKVDGVVKEFKAPVFSARTSKESRSGSDSTVASWFMGGVVDTAGAGVLATRGRIEHPASGEISDSAFAALFKSGSYAYSEGVAELTYVEGGEIYSTIYGDQSGSSFIINEMMAMGSAKSPRYKTVIRVNCKVYNKAKPSESKKITDGVLVAEFDAQ